MDGLVGLWIYGPPGFGKSFLARKRFDGDYYPKTLNKWWCGYDKQPTVIIDDFEPKHADIFGYYLKIWLDKYPFMAEVKGSNFLIRPRNVIVTSNYSITECFPDDAYAQTILRRVSVTHVTMKLF